ncbi:MAG TPA: 3-keto-5-aminohexanoate cleavage protein [Myxococcales bacterium]|nr:3-keto-5-aminohexanoate cleavage protein [Myxococcales bacterium]
MPLVEDKVVVTCAVTGVLANREQCPYLPYTPVEIAEECKRAHDAGAAVVHIHGREDDGSQTWSTQRYQAIKDEVRKRCPIIINFSTGGFGMGCSSDAEKREKIEYVWKVKPEMAALNMGSMNYAKYSEKRKGFVFDFIFANPFSEIVMACEAMREGGVKPELECFDVGHIHNAEPLLAMGALKGPLQYSFVMNVLGGVAPTVTNMEAMSRGIRKDDTWEVIGISKVQWRLVASALILGGNIRVGLEDNFYLDPAGTRMAKSNGELVEKAVRMARDVGREPMTPDEARKALGIPQQW